MKERIIGIDVGRALAVIGMIIVNFKMAFGNSGNEFLLFFADIFDGKASAIFVTLAGLGISLALNKNGTDNSYKSNTRIKIAKRALFLFIIGVLYSPIWQADILHFYGVYMLFTLLFVKRSNSVVLSAAVLNVLVYPILMMLFNYEAGWDFNSFQYIDFWTLEGFLRNLFYNGFNPVFPWVAFMLMGLWFGRQKLNDSKFLKKSLLISGIFYFMILLFSKSILTVLSEGNQDLYQELELIFGTGPIPPLPIYMLSAGSMAIFIISSCILISQKFRDYFIIKGLEKTGKLALTFYVAHVVIGIGMVEVIAFEKMGTLKIEFSVCYALLFSAACILFAYLWLQKYKMGPLESVMRRIT